MQEYKLELFGDEGYQFRKRAEDRGLPDGNVGEDGFYLQGVKKTSLRKLWNYLKDHNTKIRVYVGDGVIERVEKAKNGSTIAKNQVLGYLAMYAAIAPDKEKV